MLFQFVVAIVGALVIAQLFAQIGARAVLGPCLLLWTLLFTLGLINDRRPYAVRAEVLRLVLIVPATAVFVPIDVGGLGTVEFWPLATAYSGASLAVLFLAHQFENVSIKKSIKYN